MTIKGFNKFVESISGTELVGPIGPAYGDTRLPNKTLSSLDTNVIYCDLDSKIYTMDDYNYIYSDYLKMGGTPLIGFSLENISTILLYFKNRGDL